MRRLIVVLVLTGLSVTGCYGPSADFGQDEDHTGSIAYEVTSGAVAPEYMWSETFIFTPTNLSHVRVEGVSSTTTIDHNVVLDPDDFQSLAAQVMDAGIMGLVDSDYSTGVTGAGLCRINMVVDGLSKTVWWDHGWESTLPPELQDLNQMILDVIQTRDPGHVP
jgi:hypothetical protein